MKLKAKIGDRVRHNTFEWLGTVEGPTDNPKYVYVKWDHPRPHKPEGSLVYADSISLLPRENPVHVSFRRVIGETLTQLQGPPLKNTKDDIVRRLGIGIELASRGKAVRDTAKKEAERLGIILPIYEPGVANVYDSPAFSVVANTSEPSTRLDEQALRTALTKEDVTGFIADRIIAAARVLNKPATRFAIEEK